MNPGMTVAKGATISEGTPKVVRVMAAIGTVKTMLKMKKIDLIAVSFATTRQTSARVSLLRVEIENDTPQGNF